MSNKRRRIANDIGEEGVLKALKKIKSEESAKFDKVDI